jgi:hypothetical protein
MDIAAFNAAFTYRADRRDTWRVLRGPYDGDCDDYAATVLWITEGGWRGFWWSILIFRAVFWLVLDSKGERHIVLRHRKLGYIYNHFPYWRDTMGPHRRRWPIPLPIVAWQMILGKLLKD